MIGPLRQQAFLKSLGFFEPTPLELVEAPGAKPLIPKKWPEIVTITTSYGHGMSASPMHLAAAYAAIANGGIYLKPTLLRQDGPAKGVRVLSERVAHDAQAMLRLVVTEGTASLAEVPGYEVAGKTGTADKPKKSGGYYKDKVINTFASMFRPPTRAMSCWSRWMNPSIPRARNPSAPRLDSRSRHGRDHPPHRPADGLAALG